MVMAKKPTNSDTPKAKKLDVYFMPDGRSVKAASLKEAMELFSKPSK